MVDDLSQWWKDWWEEDYSWEGLAQKPWQGWCVLPDGQVVEDPSSWPIGSPNHGSQPLNARSATLQDYWRDQEYFLIECPVSGKSFTPIHLPLEWQNGSITPNVDQCEILRAKLSDVTAGEFDFLGRPIGPDRRAQLEGAVLRNFNVEFFAPNRDSKNLNHLIFSATRSFFCGPAFFSGARFSGCISFKNAAFSSYVTFAGAEFSGFSDFEGAAFSEVVWFDNARFGKEVRFTDANFSRGIWFSDATFSSDAVFRCAVFEEHAVFKGAAFVGRVWFNNAVFADLADFSGLAETLEQEETLNTLFLKGAVGKAAYLDGVLKSPKSDSPVARRSFGLIDARDAVFFGDAIFENRQINERAIFDGACFMRSVSFANSDLRQSATFLGVTFEASLAPGRQHESRSKANSISTVPYWALKRRFQAESYRREFTRQAAISFEMWFHEFERKRAKAATNFRNMPQDALEGYEMPSKEQYFAKLEDGFRILKRAMEENRNRPEEGRFFELELRARRQRRGPAVPFWERALSDLYRWSSDYGNSAIRPVMWLLVLIPCFAAIYSSLATLPIRAPTGTEWVEALNYSAGRMVPFGPWGSVPPACTVMGRLLDLQPTAEQISRNPACVSNLRNGYGPWTAFGISALATLQSLLALILAFLAALAARRRFQIN